MRDSAIKVAEMRWNRFLFRFVSSWMMDVEKFCFLGTARLERATREYY